MKLSISMITGDTLTSALLVAGSLSIPIDNVIARAYPEDKRKSVEEL